MDYPVLVRPGKPSWNMIPPQTTKVNAERLPIFEKRSRSGEKDDRLGFEAGSAPQGVL